MKIIRSIVLGVLLILPYALFAQKDSVAKANNNFISVGFGASFPVGSFAATNSTGFGHYATPGRSSFLWGGLMLKKHRIGFAIKEGWYTCGFSPDKYLNTLQAKDTVPGGTYWPYGSDNQYSGGYGMLGVIFNIPYHKFILNLRLLGGRFTAIFPEVKYVITTSSSPNEYFYDFYSTQTSAFAFDAGVNLRYCFSKRFSAVFDAGVVHSSFVYSTSVQYTDASGSQVTGNISYNCQVTIINTVLGLAYAF